MSDGYTAKVRPEKVETVERIRSEIGETQAVVLTEYRGLTVGELADLRRKLLDQATSYRVEKNTLARRAVVDAGLGELESLLEGPVAVAYVKGDPVSAAKVLATFAKDHPALVIKGGVLEGRVLTSEETKALATVDTLDVSRAKIAGLLIAPLQQLMMLLEAPTARIIYVLEQLGSRAEAAPAEASAEEQAPAAEVNATEQATEETSQASTAEAQPEPQTEPAEVTATEEVSEEESPASTAEAKPEPETEGE